MKRTWMALGIVGCLSGTALAAQETALPPTSSEVTVHRYAFDALGRSADEAAAEACGGGQVGAKRVHRTMGDAAAMVFTAFWYTPQHVTVDCAPAAPVR
jgi:hypothetical protein